MEKELEKKLVKILMHIYMGFDDKLLINACWNNIEEGFKFTVTVGIISNLKEMIDKGEKFNLDIKYRAMLCFWLVNKTVKKIKVGGQI